MGRSKKHYTKGEKVRAQWENNLEIDLRAAIDIFPLVNTLMKKIASYSNMPQVINRIVITLADCYIRGVSPTNDISLLKDTRLKAYLKLKDSETFDKIIFHLLLVIDEMILFLTAGETRNGHFCREIEDIIIPPIEDEDDLIIIYEED